jgi:hemoglobin/transferrin/lactoferrin receptor protein
MKSTIPSALILFAGAVHAEPAPSYLGILQELERITVTATLNDRASKDVANVVSIIDAAEIDRRQVQDIGDLVRYEPGVSVVGDPTRFGLGGFRIRGLDGDRVRIEVDGVPVAQDFSIGSFSNAGRDLVDVDALKQVEVIRGSSSSLYGSDALGGVVSFITKDPSDYVGADGGQYLAGKLQYATVNRQTSLTGTYAGADANSGFVLVATRRDGHASDNQGDIDSSDSTRTRPNPQETQSNAVLAKWVHTAASGRVDRITLDGEQATVDTDVLSSRRSQAGGVRTTSLLGEDERERLRVAMGQEIPLSATLFDSLEWMAFVQSSDTVQETLEDRDTVIDGTPTNPLQRFRRFEHEQRVAGAELIARNQASLGTVEHELTYGLEISRTRTEEMRDGFQLNVLTGVSTPNVLPDVFPVRDFPITDTTNAAFFAQDEMRLRDGQLHLLPSLRIDHYRLNPRNDAVFAEDNPGIEPQGLDRTSWSPRFGAVWHFNSMYSAFAQYSQGFRAPPFDDVNLGFTNLAFGYTAIPNPDLKPERSKGLEIGLRASGEIGYFSVSAYNNRYRDFIESLAFVGFDESGLMVFQSRNRSKVEIRGVEARYGLSLGAWSDALEGFVLRGSLATARGDDESANQPLASIDPAKAVIGLVYDRDRWGVELIASMVARKDRLPPGDVENGVPDPFVAPGYSTLDLYTHWDPLPNLELFAAISNLTDKTYWNWGFAQGLSAGSPTLDRYSSPGREASIGLRARF